MKFFGIILIIFGGFWTLSRLLNQRKMFWIIREKIKESGLMFGIRRYLAAELFGLGLGLGVMGLGLYLFNPEFLSFFFWGAGILLASIFLWGSFELGTLPQAFIIIFGIIGFLNWGLVGLAGGLVSGWIAAMLIGLLTIPLTKIFNLGLIKKEHRIAIASEFFSRHKKDILYLKKFQSMREEKIIETFSKYINQIQDEIARLPNPERLHEHDWDTGMYRANWEKAGENWVNKFKDENEKELMREYVNFCIDAIYRNYDRYIYPSMVDEEPLLEPPEPLSKTVSICPNCGTKIKKSASFCTQCGTKIKI